MLIGAEVDDVAFVKLIEDTGASVVVDDLCPGARENLPLVDITDDPLDGIAERYLRKIHCAKTYFEQTGTYRNIWRTGSVISKEPSTNSKLMA